MRKEAFCEVLGEIDAVYVKEARMRKKAKRLGWVRWGAIAACLCIAVSGLLLYRAEHPYPVKELAVMTTPEIGKIPRWEDMEIYDQYSEIIINDLQYQAGKGEVSAEQLGAELGTITAKGWDSYAKFTGEDANRYCNATVYEIQNISVECAVAVQYTGTNTCYSAVNDSYRPDTLGQFTKDLDLENTLVVHWASYEYQKPLSGAVSVRFENLDTDMVWDLLLSNDSATNEYDDLDFDQPQEILGICVSVPLLGYENISISVRENGYIITNILSTGKMFYVGEENTQSFVDYVLRECDGYEIVYTSDPTQENIPE